jgi:hypothetical protein
MQDDTTRHGIGGNNPPEQLDEIESPILSLPRSRKYLGELGQSTLYEKMNEGEFEIVRLGGRTFLTKRSLDAYIARNTQPSKADRKSQPRNIVRNIEPSEVRTKPRVPRPKKQALVPGKLRQRRNDERRTAPP